MTSPTVLPRTRGLLFALAWTCSGLWSTGLAAEPPTDPNAAAVLHLTNGGFVPGSIRDSDRAGVFRWQSGSFVEPFDFDLGVVESVQFPGPAEPRRPAGDWCFELAGGDVLLGTLLALDDQVAVLDAAGLGRLHVQRARIRRMDRLGDGAELVYLGPNGLGDWREPTPPGSWRQELGQLATEQPKALLRGNLGLPARAVVEFEISWLKKPDFILALGVGDDAATDEQAFRFQVWDNVVVALLETSDELVLAPVGKAFPGPGRIHLRAYLDQEQGRLLVTSPVGATLADLRRGGAWPRPHTGIALGNIRGDVRLERLRIGCWGREVPAPALAKETGIQRIDESVVTGQITRLDAASRELVVRDRSSETRVPLDQVAGVLLAHGNGNRNDNEPVQTIHVVTRDGVGLSGALLQVQEDALVLSLPGVKEFPRVPVAQLRSLAVLRHEQPLRAVERDGVLEIDRIRLPGRLRAHDGQHEARAGASCLAWQPQGSATASHLRAEVSGKIIFKEPPPRPTTTAQQPDVAIRFPKNFAAGRVVVQMPDGTLVVRSVERADSAAQAARGRPSLHLRTGDAIPAEVTRIDADGVWFRSPMTKSTFAAHDKVKAVELGPEAFDAIRLSKAKRERLLTLPRMQKDAPPTHLICSMDGDYLRGRVLAMDDVTLQVEVHLETKDVPRFRIARIIWLHADELDAAKPAAKPAEGEGEGQGQGGPGLRVQAVLSDGNRLTFVAEQLADASLSGKSDVLGDCRVALGEMDQLLIGGEIERATAELAYQQWMLQHATEPRVAQGDEGGAAGRAAGTEAALVGKPAPDFELELLGGAKFRLAEAKGQVLILDFWATWCGPCIQAMPQVQRVAEEFRDRGVQLVAVNVQETPQQIATTLERHKLHPSVALDKNGNVAEKYGAQAIPLIVIIDRDGTVARLFSGGGPHLDDQLRDALGAVLQGGEANAGVGK